MPSGFNELGKVSTSTIPPLLIVLAIAALGISFSKSGGPILTACGNAGEPPTVRAIKDRLLHIKKRVPGGCSLSTRGNNPTNSVKTEQDHSITNNDAHVVGSDTGNVSASVGDHVSGGRSDIRNAAGIAQPNLTTPTQAKSRHGAGAFSDTTLTTTPAATPAAYKVSNLKASLESASQSKNGKRGSLTPSKFNTSARKRKLDAVATSDKEAGMSDHGTTTEEESPSKLPRRSPSIRRSRSQSVKPVKYVLESDDAAADVGPTSDEYEDKQDGW
jgi:hypothetical protein